MEVEEISNNKQDDDCNGTGGDSRCKRTTFGEKCSNIAKKQRAKFYIVRRCVAMLVCWRGLPHLPLREGVVDEGGEEEDKLARKLLLAKQGRTTRL
ncbi:hypothetical protein QVD17_36309 [Tagetes erecta]|uniref:Uncharacterized protein n=1 Tax=Tagetes erecta TaxID=13708 RepID=A0AAD8JYC3_TARER|nr:hypothetical protein QVD17_36309 [Tagetes erecta]